MMKKDTVLAWIASTQFCLLENHKIIGIWISNNVNFFFDISCYLVGDCMHENRLTSDLMVPMIITSSPTSPHIFENQAKLDEDTETNTS